MKISCRILVILTTLLSFEAAANTCIGGKHFYYVVESKKISYVGTAPAAPLSGVDISSFKVLPFEHGGICSTGKEEYYATDKRSIFFQAVQIDGADVKSFVILPLGIYAKDKHSVYFEGKPLKGADPVTFQLLKYIDDAPPNGGGWSNYATDKKHVWKDGSIVPGKTPQTFSGPKQTD